MATLAESYSRIQGVTAGMRHQFAKAIGGTSGGSAGLGGDVANYYGLSARQSDNAMFDDATMANASRLYRAAMRDHQFAAIRPLAVKVAEQSLRVGRGKSSGESRSPVAPGMMTKELRLIYDDAPEYVQKSLASDDIEPIASHPLIDLFDSPNPYMTKSALLYCTAYSMESVGETVWWVDFDGESKSIWYWPRSWIKPITINGVAYAKWKVQIPGIPDDFPLIDGENVINFRYPNPADPTKSHSPTQAQSRAINTDDHIQESQLASMKNSIRPTLGIVIGDVLPDPMGGRMQPELTPEQRKQLISAIRMAYRGAMHTGDPIILDALVRDVRQIFPSPAELDYQNGSALTKNRILSGYGTSRIVMGETEGANRASSYVAHEAFYSLRVNPLLALISEELTRKVGPRFSNGEKLYVWLTKATADDVEIAIRQYDSLAKYSFVRPNEMRAKFGLPPDKQIEEWWVKKQEQAAQQPPAPAQSQPGATPPAGRTPKAK